MRLGDSAGSSWTYDSTKIAIWETAAHAAGAIDVVVTNPGGREDRLTGGYTYEPPDSFDFNGGWIAHAGSEYDIDMRFTIRKQRGRQRLVRHVWSLDVRAFAIGPWWRVLISRR